MNRQEQIRKEALFQLYADRPKARTAAQMEREARKQGLDFTASDFKRELTFLADDGLLIQIPMAGSSEQMFRIHASGVKHYEQNFAA